MTEQLLLPVALAEAVFVLVTVLILVGCVATRGLRRRRDARSAGRLRELVREAVLGQVPPGAACAALRGLPLARRRAVLLELVGAVGGIGLGNLRRLAEAAGLTAHAERWCRSRRWWRRLRGLRVLAQLGGDRAALHRFLDDPHPAVRAAAADAVAAPVPSAVVARLLTMVGDRDALCRFSALAALLRAGSDAAAGVREYLDADPGPHAAEVLAVAVTLADPGFLGPALRLSTAADPAVRRGVAVLLAGIGGTTAIGVLKHLVTDGDPGVRAAAARGLGELGHWPAASALAGALEDDSWEVRRASALALRRLGPAGRVYLRRTTHSGDPFAADIARQVLALPDTTMSLVARTAR